MNLWVRDEEALEVDGAVARRVAVVRPVAETAGCAIQAAKGRLAGGH